MKVVHISTSDSGGAGIAAVRLHNALLNAGIESFLLTKLNFVSNIRNHFVLNPETLFSRVLVRSGLKRNIYRALTIKHLANRPSGYEKFSFPFSEIDLTKHPIVKKADIINLHWVSDRFLDFESFFTKIKKPVIWTLHDMNPFTGGCHHADDSIGFEEDCHNCPQLKGTIDVNFAKTVLTIKKKALKSISVERLKIIAPSQWLMNLSKQSSLFKKYQHNVIPNIIDFNKTSVSDKRAGRIKLNLPAEKKIILFISNDISHSRKGFGYLEQAVKLLDQDIVVCGIGNNSSKLSFSNFIDLGYIKDKARLAQIYSAADVYVLPSHAENFPNTICESLIMGTPVVAFNVGGIPELINENNGRLAEYKNVQSLADSITYVLSNPSKFNSKEIQNETIQKLEIGKIVKQHIDLYQSLIIE